MRGILRQRYHWGGNERIALNLGALRMLKLRTLKPQGLPQSHVPRGEIGEIRQRKIYSLITNSVAPS